MMADVTVDRAHRYARYVAPTFVTLARRAIDLADIEPGQSVLDAGTATGLAAVLAAERAGRDGSVIGLDASAAMLTVARERSALAGYDYIRWELGDASQLAYADESFDAVLCVQALQDMPRPTAVLEELRRVLVEGGRLALTIWGSKAGNEWLRVLDEAVRRAVPGARLPGPPALSEPGNLEAVLQSCGFEEIEAARVPDRMRFQGIDGFWEWALATQRWGEALERLPVAAQGRVRAALGALLEARRQDGELALRREIVYARAVAPESA